MSEPERIKMALSGDPEITDAVMLANPVLSGIPAFVHGEIVEKVVATRHQTRSAELEASPALFHSGNVTNAR